MLKILGPNPRSVRLVAYVHLYQGIHRSCFSTSTQDRGESKRVHRLDYIEVLQRRLRLVALEMTDHVPAHSRASKLSHTRNLRLCFLDEVLAQVRQTQLNCLRDALRWHCLECANQGDAAWLSSGRQS